MSKQKTLIFLGVILLFVQLLSFSGMSRMYVGLYPDNDDLLYPVYSTEQSNLTFRMAIFAFEAGNNRFMEGFRDLFHDITEYRVMSVDQMTSAMIRESLGCNSGGSVSLTIYDIILTISYCFVGIIGAVFLTIGSIFYFVSGKKELEHSTPTIPVNDFCRTEQKSTDEKPSPESADMPPVRQHKTRPQNRTSPILVVAIIVLFALNIFQFVSSRTSIAELKSLVYELHGLELIEATEAKPTIKPSTSNPADQSSVPEPYTGYIFKNLQADLTAPLTIETEGECGFYVILDPIELTGTFHGKYPESNYDAWKQMEAQEESYIKLYIRSNSLHKFKVPPGEYEVYYATGKSWQGFSDLFGPKTIYYKYADSFTFEDTEAGYDAVTVKLISPDISGSGIMEISSADFPH